MIKEDKYNKPIKSKKIKTIAWNEVKRDYLSGITPKELAEKYGLTAKQIHDKSSKERWVDEKASISENLRVDVQERISKLTNKALKTLEEVIDDPETENNIKVQASKALLDISGLKSQQINGTGLTATNVIINREAVNVESLN